MHQTIYRYVTAHQLLVIPLRAKLSTKVQINDSYSNETAPQTLPHERLS